MLSDPWGHNRYCFTPIASYIINTSKAAILMAVGGKMSPVMMAMYMQFGDPLLHEPCTASTTLAQLATASTKANLQNIEAFFQEVQKFCLNSVEKPFWQNYLLSCPNQFITPELLHYIHKEFWNHHVKWCINVLGPAKINFQFLVLQPITDFCHFKEGISGLMQVTS